MDLDPRIRKFLEEGAAALAAALPEGLEVAERRRRADAVAESLHRKVAEPGPPVVAVERRQVAVEGGTIPLRVYIPEGEGPFPGHVLLHGGGWWQGSIDDWISDVQARERCAGSSSVVVTVGYRLAPEHPFPTGLHDCRAAWLWVLAHAEELGIDPERCSLGGVSAGGNLAAALCLLLRDRGEPLPLLQLLEAPALDFSYHHPSMREYGPLMGLSEEAWLATKRLYLPNAGDEDSPYASPLQAQDLAGLPAARILTCEYDPLRDAAEGYAERLAASGVPVKLTRYRGQVHTSPVMTAILEAAREWRSEVVGALSLVPEGLSGGNR